jgi:hypothetical protein
VRWAHFCACLEDSSSLWLLQDACRLQSKSPVHPKELQQASHFTYAPFSYEFGTQYTESEFLQRFKYRAADINEHIDPAYWHTHSVHRGTERKKPLSLLSDWFRYPESHLQVKILVRKQADTVTADIGYYL